MAAAILAASLFPSVLSAQQTIGPEDSAVAPPPGPAIGPPQLRDFQLPGTRVVPAQPRPAPAPQAAPPATVVVPAPQPSVREPAPRAVEARPAPDPTPPPATSRAADSIAPPPVTISPIDPMAPSAVEEPAPAPVVAPPEPASSGTDEPPVSPSYLIALAAGLGILMVLALLLRSRRRRASSDLSYQLAGEAPVAFAPPRDPVPDVVTPPVAREANAAVTAEPVSAPAADPDPPAYLVRRAESEPTPPAQPATLPAPVDDGLVGIQLRPWLQLQFRPDRATATDTDASVQFELVIANTGNATARNIRIAAGMFNAGPELEQEVKEFFAMPMPADGRGQVPDIPARSASSVRSAVSLPKANVREIEIQGRRLFIPTVAFSVCYDWGIGKSGRTSMSFLVGREAEEPSSKMGPFRLDQGPRIYRQVGQRPSQPAVLV